MHIDNLDVEDDPFVKNAKNVFAIPAGTSPLIAIPCELWVDHVG